MLAAKSFASFAGRNLSFHPTAAQTAGKRQIRRSKFVSKQRAKMTPRLPLMRGQLPSLTCGAENSFPFAEIIFHFP
jgi:hypothetical protein